jgi:hypothetical protein
MESAVIDYLRNVLGINSVPKTQAQPSHWLVAFISEVALSPEESELVTKIASAMQLGPQDWILVHENWALQIQLIEQSNFVICFSEDLYKNLKSNFPQLKLFKVSSPKEMINQPSLKKQAWEVLRNLPAKV